MVRRGPGEIAGTDARAAFSRAGPGGPDDPHPTPRLPKSGDAPSRVLTLRCRRFATGEVATQAPSCLELVVRVGGHARPTPRVTSNAWSSESGSSPRAG